MAAPTPAKRNPRTAYICDECRAAKRERRTCPGVHHLPGICDCKCLDGTRR